MMWLWIAVTLFVVAGFVVFTLLRGRFSEPKNIDELVRMLKPVSPRALSQLTSKSDDELLRKTVPLKRYRILRRQRFLALKAYCLTALENCAALQAYGQALQRSSDFGRGEFGQPDLETRQFGRELAAVCLSLRLQLLRAVAAAQLSIWLPDLEIDLTAISGIYASKGEHLLSSSKYRTSVVRRVLEQAFPVA